MVAGGGAVTAGDGEESSGGGAVVGNLGIAGFGGGLRAPKRPSPRVFGSKASPLPILGRAENVIMGRVGIA